MLLKLKQLARDSIIYSIGGIVTSAIGFFLVPVYTRVFAPSQYGVLEILLIFQAFLITLIDLGISSAQTRYFYNHGKTEHKCDIVSTPLLFRLIWGSVIIGICLLAASTLNNLLFNGEVPDSYFYIVCLAALFSVILGSLVGVYRLLLQPKPYLALTLSQSLLSSVLIIILVVYFKQGIWGYLIGYSVSILLIIPMAAFLLREYIVFKFSVSLIIKFLKFGIPLIPINTAIWVMNFADRYFLSRYATLGDVGLYAIGAKFGLAIGLITMSFRLAWMPLSFSVAREPDAKAFYRNVADLYLVGASFIVILITGISKLLLIVMTQPDFYAGYLIVGILAYGAVFYGFYTISGLGLWLGDKTIFATIALIAAAILNVALNIVLIPIWGTIGAAVATVIAYMAGNALCFYFGETCYPIGFNYHRLGATILITCAGIALQLILLGSVLPLFMQYGLILLIWVTIGSVFAFKIIGRDRIEVFKTTLEKYLHEGKGSK